MYKLLEEFKYINYLQTEYRLSVLYFITNLAVKWHCPQSVYCIVANKDCITNIIWIYKGTPNLNEGMNENLY